MPAGVSAYVALANITLGSSAVSVTFSSISQSYRDLVLVCSVKGSGGNVSPMLRFNSDTGANYNRVFMAATYGGQSLNFTYLNLTDSANAGSSTWAQVTTDILDYSVTNKHKSSVSTSVGVNGAEAVIGRWASTSAISTLQIFDSTGAQFGIGSTFALYGIAG